MSQKGQMGKLGRVMLTLGLLLALVVPVATPYLLFGDALPARAARSVGVEAPKAKPAVPGKTRKAEVRLPAVSVPKIF